MEAVIRIKGDKHRYDVRAKECIGMVPVHQVSSRAPTCPGRGWLGICARRDYDGWPLPEFDKALAAEGQGRDAGFVMEFLPHQRAVYWAIMSGKYRETLVLWRNPNGQKCSARGWFHADDDCRFRARTS